MKLSASSDFEQMMRLGENVLMRFLASSAKAWNGSYNNSSSSWTKGDQTQPPRPALPYPLLHRASHIILLVSIGRLCHLQEGL